MLPRIADHNMVRLDLALPETTKVFVERTVWRLREADWSTLEKELLGEDWAPLKRGTTEDAVNLFLELLRTLLIHRIPRERTKCKHNSHPWLNSRCDAAILKKQMQKAMTVV